MKNCVLLNLALWFSFLFSGLNSTIKRSKEQTGHIVYPNIQTLESGQKRLTFRTIRDEVDTILSPAGKSIADNLAFVEHKDGKRVKYNDMSGIKRNLFSDRNNGGVLHIDEEGPLTIRGLVNSELKIEPAKSRLIRKDGKMAHRVTRITRKEKLNLNDDVSSINIRTPSTFMKREEEFQLKEDECFVIEIAVVADYSVSEYLLNQEDRLNTNVTDKDYLIIYYSIVFTEVQNIFDTLEANITIRFTGLISYTKETEPSCFYESAESDSNYNVTVWGKCKDYHYDLKLPLLEEADLVFIMSKRYFNSNAGYAYVGTMCDRYWKYGLAQLANNPVYTASILSHEVGHFLKIDHWDSEKCTGFPYVNNYVVTDFSTCSRDEVKDFLSKTHKVQCLIEKCNITAIE